MVRTEALKPASPKIKKEMKENNGWEDDDLDLSLEEELVGMDFTGHQEESKGDVRVSHQDAD